MIFRYSPSLRKPYPPSVADATATPLKGGKHRRTVRSTVGGQSFLTKPDITLTYGPVQKIFNFLKTFKFVHFYLK